MVKISVLSDDTLLLDNTLLASELPSDTVVQKSDLDTALNMENGTFQTDIEKALTAGDEDVEDLEETAAGEETEANDLVSRFSSRTGDETDISTDTRDGAFPDETTAVEDTDALEFEESSEFEDVTLSLNATPTLTEDGGIITYTVNVDNAPQSDMLVTLNNGLTVTIFAGTTSGTASTTILEAEFEDVYLDSDVINVFISETTDGGFTNVDYITNGNAVTQITDTIDETSVSLSATPSISEAGAVVTYTATLTNASQGDTVVTLDNGESITIADGDTSSFVNVTVPADEDPYVDATSMNAAITNATGGNFENLTFDDTPAVTQITDTIDETSVSLSATPSISEAGAVVTYTATLTNASQGDTVVTLDNGESITIADGDTSSFVNVTVPADEDPYVDATSMNAAITNATGGNFENLTFDDTPAVTQITDTIDETSVSLSATPSISEAGAVVTYTATLTNASQGDTVVTLDNGESITIADGDTSSFVNVTVPADEDPYVDATSMNAAITNATGGNFENLTFDDTPAVTQITDTIDETSVSLSATPSISEAGAVVTYTPLSPTRVKATRWLL